MASKSMASRRGFLRSASSVLVASTLLGSLVPAASGASIKSDVPPWVAQKMIRYKQGQQIPSVCAYCAGGCGILVTTLNGEVVEYEGDPYHPINKGALCSKAGSYIQVVNSDRRLLHPVKRTNPRKGKDEDPHWVQITWDEALDLIAQKVKEALVNLPYRQGQDYFYVGKDNPIAWLGSSYWNNEECYLGRKLISLLGSNNVEHQARKCHASTVAALANTFGFGAMTNHIIDAKNSKCFLIMSNPAESHTLEFGWVTEAVERNGAKVIVLDPRYNRTASKADIYVRYRSGSEAAIFLGLIRYVLFERSERIDWEFIEKRTNAPFKIDGTGPLADWKMNPESIFGQLKEIAGKYTPEEVERISGISKAKLVEIADTFSANKPSNIYYAMGTTQHTNATQAIRSHAILQLLLGNIGRPGGGVNALRGISNVQGSTDMNLLSHIIMGYRSPPQNVEQIRRYQKWKNGGGPGTSGKIDEDTARRGGSREPKRITYPWSDIADAEGKTKASEFRFDDRHFPTWNALEYHWGVYVGTWPGTDPDNEPVVCDLPVGNGNAIVQLFRAVNDGVVKVLICNGENPAVSMPNVDLVRDALSKPGLFTVVNELFETETAHYADILLPGTSLIERSGSITNSGRWIQWRWKAKEPPGECKPELWYLTELYKRIRSNLKKAGITMPSEKFEMDNFTDVKKLVGSETIQNDPEVCWPTRFVQAYRKQDEYSYLKDDFSALAESIYKEIGAKSITVGGVLLPQAAANVLYKNSYDPELRPDIDGLLPKRRDPRPVDDEDRRYGYFKNWAFTWMLNQRVLYDVNESNPGVKTFFVWFATSPEAWLDHTIDRAAIWSKPLYDPNKPQSNPLGRGMPLHNEPLESPDRSLAAEYPSMWDNRFNVNIGDPDEYPYILTTFRLAEHMQAGGMTRNQPWLVECQPEMFVEISKQLAAEIGVGQGDQVIVRTARKPQGVTVKAIVTERIQPLRVNGRILHEIAMPWHWGFKGLSQGPSANELTVDAVDSSANIPEYKACLCRLEKA